MRKKRRTQRVAVRGKQYRVVVEGDCAPNKTSVRECEEYKEEVETVDQPGLEGDKKSYMPANRRYMVVEDIDHVNQY